MKELCYSLVVEATDDPAFYSYFSPDLPGYTGWGESLVGAVTDALEHMDEYIEFMRESGAEIPPPALNPQISFLRPAALADRSIETGT